MNQRKLLLGSHFFFFIPLGIAVSHKLYLYALVVAVTTATSYEYHLHPKSFWQASDRLTALALIASNFYLFNLTTFDSGWFIAAMVLALVAFACFFKASKDKYYPYHALWHFFSALITLCSVLGYINQ